MKLEPVGHDPREVLRGLRGAVLGAGPAIALGAGQHPDAVPAGTAVVIATSGSSGHPKRVAISRAALTSSALATADRLGAGAWLLALPASYVAGVQVLVRALVAGHEPAILAGSFSSAAFTAAASGMASSVGGTRIPTFTALVPAQLQTLLDSPDATRGLASFEAVLVGGQALPPGLAERAATAGVRVVRTYGSTETSGGCVYDGSPLPGVGVQIVGGEVRLSGPTLADGYLGEPERTDRSFVRGPDGVRWYRTGDAGSFDGVLTVTGRIDNVIVSGGVNVSLDRVEQIVRTVAGLEQAVVVPVVDERWGQASVVAAPRVALDAVEDTLAVVRGVVGAALGKPARPRGILPLEQIPVLASGKPDRAALRRLAAGA